MSVAGILASSLFADAGSQIAQESPSATNGLISGAQSSFAALQKQLAGTSSTSGTTSAPGQLAQLGQDLSLGNLPAAQSDFANFQVALQQSRLFNGRFPHAQPQSTAGSSSQVASSTTSGQSDPLSAAMAAYSSLQQNPINNSLGASLTTPTGTFAVDA